jgi:hypothetical protein
MPEAWGCWLKNRIFPAFLPFGFAIKALWHCEEGFIALRKSLCGETIEA